MLAQVGHLGSRYAQWVENPVDKPLRLFHANFLEALTKTPWWVIPLVWIPVILIFLYTGWNKLATSGRYKDFYLFSININFKKNFTIKSNE